MIANEELLSPWLQVWRNFFRASAFRKRRMEVRVPKEPGSVIRRLDLRKLCNLYFQGDMDRTVWSASQAGPMMNGQIIDLTERDAQTKSGRGCG